MTARRPSRISGSVPVDGPREEQYRRLLRALNEDGGEHEASGSLQEAVNVDALQFARDLTSHTASAAIHPALTDYGPASAATFFRQARAIHHLPALRRPLAPLRPGLRPRSARLSRTQSKQLCNDSTPSDWPVAVPREEPALVKSPTAENQHPSDTPFVGTDVRAFGSRPSDDTGWGDENQLPSRKNGPKRARRTSNREGNDNDENPPQAHSVPHGATLLRDMRLRRAAQRDREDFNSHQPMIPVDQDTLVPVTEVRAGFRPSGHDGLVSVNAAERSMQDEIRVVGGGVQTGDDDDLSSVIDSSLADVDAEALPVPDQWISNRVRRTRSRRTSLGNRRSTLSPPTRCSQTRRSLFRDSVVRSLLEKRDYELESSDDDSMSSQDASVLNAGLADADPRILRRAAQNLPANGEDNDSHDMAIPFLDYLMAPVLSTEQQESPSQQSASDPPIVDLTTYQRSFRYEQIAPASSLEHHHRGGRTASCQHHAAPKPGEEKAAARVEEGLAAGKIQALPYSKNESKQLQSSRREPPFCQPKGTSRGWPNVPTEIYFEIARYLSREDALNLRLVCRDFSIAMMGPVFGSVVVPFGRTMYDTNPTTCVDNPPSASMFEKYGLAIRKFGISFEADADLIAKARTKTISNEQSSWWGKYKWPTPVYPRFNHLHSLENLADNVLLLKSAMANLGKTHELGLSVDSGHGWLNGPDISDMALFNNRCGKGTKVFGKNLSAEDKQKQATRAHLFECAQAKTLQECTEIMQVYNKMFHANDLAFLRTVAVRDMESFRSIERQPDFDTAAHVGGAIPTDNSAANVVQQPVGGQHHIGGANQHANGGLNAGVYHIGPVNPFQPALMGQNFNNPPINPNQPHHNIAVTHPANFHNIPFLAPPTQPNVTATNLPQDHTARPQNARDRDRNQSGAVKVSKRTQTTQPQFPLIFNGYNLSAEIGGWCHLIQRRVAAPASFPLQPGTLTEAQAQWLMETLWAQRAFLSAYTTSVLVNQACFAQVHSLHIAKISSGLLSSLEQKELWLGLPGLTTLTLLVSPDWRVEHVTGDQGYNSNMLVSPVNASLQLTQFLKMYITPLEKLSNLTIGFVGGGEHATGIMARNQHVLPAPISSAPRTWLSDHITEPDPRTITTFNHIKHLTVQNAWFTPLMLEGFMIKSQDTSLRTLTLDSISLTATHGQRMIANLTTATESLNPVHPSSMWLHESLPTTHCWPVIIDRITPGRTFLDRKYDAGMIADPYTHPRPAPSFRGFVSRLVFRSCGYVRISGLSNQEFNQNDLVCPNSDPMDAGLKTRAAALTEKGVMLSDKDPSTGAEWPLLGKLTQCIHPVEKSVLEQAWAMRFGWDNNLERWAATEDGCFEGGIGRFSGVIVGEGGKGIGGEDA